MIRWSDVWSSAGCPLPEAIPSAGAWLKGALDADRHATAVLVVDALRFDLGARLAARLNQQEGVERAHVQPARAPLPSMTALGMALPLPLEEHKLTAEMIDGRWQVTTAGSADNLSQAEKRRGWWLANVPGVRLGRVDEVLADPNAGPRNGVTRLVLYDAAIDEAGHTDQLDYQGGAPAHERYLRIIEHLRRAGWMRIIIVTDHGYIHWPVNEEKNTEHPVSSPTCAARRYLVYPAATGLPHPWAPAPGGKWRVALPRGAASFRAYGGLGYFHGGASLQEWIIPCLTIEWPQQAQPVAVALEPMPRILSQRPRVTLTISAGSLLREDAIARQVEVVIRNRQTRAILFRSPRAAATIDTPQIELTLEMVDGAMAERNTPLTIEVRDPFTEQPLAEQEATLMVELAGW